MAHAARAQWGVDCVAGARNDGAETCWSRRGLVFLVVLCLGTPPALAHGVETRVLATGAVAVEFRFTDGSAMGFADAVAYAPGRPDEPAVAGRTDSQGRFALYPDQDGDWTVEAHDSSDHVARAIVHVAAHHVAERRRAFPDWLVAVSLVCNVLAAAWLGRGRGRGRGRGAAA
jgi:hypothetical protein